MSFLQISDLVLIVGLVVSGIIGFSKGLSKKVFNIASLVLSIFAVFFLSNPIIKLFGKEESPIEIKCIFYAAIFIFFFVLIRVLGHIFKKGVDKIGLSFFDRLFGLIWAMAFTLIIIWGVMLVCAWASKLEFVSRFIESSNLFESKGWGFTQYLYTHNMLPRILEAIASGGKLEN